MPFLISCHSTRFFPVFFLPQPDPRNRASHPSNINTPSAVAARWGSASWGTSRSRSCVWASAWEPRRCTSRCTVESPSGLPHLEATSAVALYVWVAVAVKASLSSSAGLNSWCGDKPQRSRIGQPQCRSRGSCPWLISSSTTPTLVRRRIRPAWRCTTVAWLRGENLAVASNFSLELLLQPLPRPFAAFFQRFFFEVPQGAGTCFAIRYYHPVWTCQAGRCSNLIPQKQHCG